MKRVAQGQCERFAGERTVDFQSITHFSSADRMDVLTRRCWRSTVKLEGTGKIERHGAPRTHGLTFSMEHDDDNGLALKAASSAVRFGEEWKVVLGRRRNGARFIRLTNGGKA